MGMNDFAPFTKKYGCFIVRNITSAPQKTIKIFNYPINHNQSRDLLQIPGVGESDIRASLLKGTLRNKILSGDIVVECSDIDLLQFNLDQKAFLVKAGIIHGLDVSEEITQALTAAAHERLRQLIHFIDGGGPTDGFASGAFKTIRPLASPFPTNITWWTDSTQTEKIVEKIITYTANKLPSTVTWNMYDTNGVTVIQTVTDTITYVSNSFESTRTRTIS
jgi:hypothetical protein